MRSQDLPASAAQHEFAESAGSAGRTSHYVQLTEFHHDLDCLIAALSRTASHDELLVARLKKRKLRLKDEIARLASELRSTPSSLSR